MSVQEMAEHVARLMENRLGIKGDGLAEKLRRSKGRLPRRVQRAAQALAEAAVLAGHPKLLPQIEMEPLRAAYDLCRRHLGARGQGGAGVVVLRILSTLAAGALALVALWLVATSAP